ncbi:hypothetical protein BS78_03G040700 [Paspalum vaginatum]|nr:hypothetical protein BS78_03G040700 [Paspalum vaginatum]
MASGIHVRPKNTFVKSVWACIETQNPSTHTGEKHPVQGVKLAPRSLPRFSVSEGAAASTSEGHHRSCTSSGNARVLKAQVDSFVWFQWTSRSKPWAEMNTKCTETARLLAVSALHQDWKLAMAVGAGSSVRIDGSTYGQGQAPYDIAPQIRNVSRLHGGRT